MKKILLLLLLSHIMFQLKAQTTIISIETNQNALVLQTDKDNRLGIIHFGKKISQPTEYLNIGKAYKYNDENAGIYNGVYTPSGTFNLVEPAFEILHADGNTSSDLKYISHQTVKVDENVSQISILLKDPVYPVEVTLYFKIYVKSHGQTPFTSCRRRVPGRPSMRRRSHPTIRGNW